MTIGMFSSPQSPSTCYAYSTMSQLDPGSEGRRGARPLIAVDLDDVLMATNEAVAEWHNVTYRTDSPMTMDEFYYYHYWKNPHWGTPEQTIEKVVKFYDSSAFRDAQVVEGAIEGIAALQKLGFRLAIVTARSSNQKELTEAWIDRHLPDCFEAHYYTGEFEVRKPAGSGQEVTYKMGKPDVIKTIGALMLIDDSLENALACASASPPIPVLLFGDYQWNQRPSRVTCPEDKMSFTERSKAEKGEWWKQDSIPDERLPKHVRRVKRWPEIVEMVKKEMRLESFA